MNFETLLQRMAESTTAGRSFGPAIESNGCTVVPVAYVVGGGGGGMSDKEDIGAGFGYVSVPVGAYVIRDGEVRWKPAYDVGFLSVVGFGVLRLLKHSRSRRRRLRSG